MPVLNWIFRWIFRLIKAVLFGALCGAGGYFFGSFIFGILQLFCGWSNDGTKMLVWIGTIVLALWAIVTIIRDGIEEDSYKQVLNSYKKGYEKVTGEKYTYIPSDSPKENSAAATRSGNYQHESFFGVPGGKSTYKGDKVTHTDFWGTPQVYSERKENGEIVHTDFWGTETGRSIDKGDRVEHYNEWGVYQGYSERKADGSYTNYNALGVEQGRSRKK